MSVQMKVGPMPESSSSKPAKSSFTVDPRSIWTSLSVILFMIFTSIGLTQKPRPNAYESIAAFSADWWRYPIEFNAPARLPVVESDLRDIFVLSGTGSIWIAGAGGLILHSDDGGRTWERQLSLLDSTALPDPRTQRAQNFPLNFVGQAFAQEYRQEQSKTAQETKKGYEPQVDPGQLDSNILKQQSNAAPNAQSVRQQPDFSQSVLENPDTLYDKHLNAIFFADENYGWAVGNRGNIFATEDGGENWRRQTSTINLDLSAVAFDENLHGLAVGQGGIVLYSADGGATWTLPPDKYLFSGNPDLHAVEALGNNGFAIAGASISVVGIENASAAQNWSATIYNQYRGLGNFYALSFPDDSTGWAVGSFGSVLSTNNSGQTWTSRQDTIRDLLFDGHFLDAQTGWVAGWNGTIFKTEDRGNSWRRLNTGTDKTIFATQFASANRGWAVGGRGTLLATTDGGETWFPQTNLAQNLGGQHTQLPPPWYFASWLLIALLLTPGFSKRQPEEAEPDQVHESVADMLVSDRPLEMSDPDHLNFKPIAFGLSRFVRNESTVPPLTIAITGKWGSGKSSLMNLLKSDLRAHKFQTVWFNAWHHQKEEHLLAALLENVKAQALPAWYSFENLLFRYRLFKVRLSRNWPLFVGLFLIYSTAISFLLANQAAREFLAGVLRVVENNQLPNLLQGGALLAALATILSSVTLLWRGIRAFGIKPASLMASMSGRFSVRDFSAQTGFRFRFEREFKDVTAALNPLNLIILIDDLDRCRPENVLDVLEAVNFLVASGGCFIVLGLDLERVERCVGLGFKDVAEELVLDDDIEQAGSSNGHAQNIDVRLRRAEFARQYLEKLINIEVPVPEPTADQSVALLLPPRQNNDEPPSRWEILEKQVLEPLRQTWPVLLVAAAMALGFWLGAQEFNFKVPGETRSGSVVSPPELPQIDSENQQIRNEERQRPTIVGDYQEGESRDMSQLFYVIPLLIVLSATIWRLSLPAELVVRDSDEFCEALRIWHNFIYSRQNTPRAMKRFMNRLRYFAMRLPQQDLPEPLGNRLLAWFKRLFVKNEEEKTSPKNVDELRLQESTLVALSALHNFNPRWLEVRENWAEIKAGSLPEVSENGSGKAQELTKQNLEYAIAEHKKLFGNWPPSDEDMKELLSLSQGIRV